MKPVPEQVKIGTYDLGFEYVDVFGLPNNTDACFYFQPEKEHFGRIKVGLKYRDFGMVVSLLLHEAMEYLLLRYDLGYSPIQLYTNDTGNRLFVFDHVKFTEMCGRAGCFVTEVFPDLAKVHKQHKPK